MPEVQEILNKQEPYFKCEMERKTGKYAHVVVKCTYHVPFSEKAITKASQTAFDEVKKMSQMLEAIKIEYQE